MGKYLTRKNNLVNNIILADESVTSSLILGDGETIHLAPNGVGKGDYFDSDLNTYIKPGFALAWEPNVEGSDDNFTGSLSLTGSTNINLHSSNNSSSILLNEGVIESFEVESNSIKLVISPSSSVGTLTVNYNGIIDIYGRNIYSRGDLSIPFIEE